MNPFLILDIVARAQRQQPLTPAERAFLRSLGGLWQAALAAGLVAILDAALHGGQPLTFTTLAHIGATAAVTGLVTGIAKLVSAQGDAPLGDLLSEAATRLQSAPPTAQPARPAAVTMRYSTPAQTPSGSFPPVMPDSPQRRADLLRRAGIPTITDQTTRPTPAVNPTVATAASESASTPVAAAQPSLPVAPTTEASAPSQRVGIQDAPQDAADENGPPTMEAPAVTAARDAAGLDAFLK